MVFMKRIPILITALLITLTASAQNHWPQLTVREMNGRTRNLSDYAPQEGATLFVFWKTCCPNNITMLEELYDVWQNHDQDDIPIHIVLVSVDDQRTASRVQPIVRTEGWDWPVIMDKNKELARFCQVIIPPQWVAFDPDGREVFRSKVSNGMLDSAIYFDELTEKLREAQ